MSSQQLHFVDMYSCVPAKLRLYYVKTLHVVHTVLFSYAMVTCKIKLFQCFISHIWNYFKIISAAEIISNYFSDIEHVRKYSWAAISFWNNFEIISGKIVQTDIDKGRNNFESCISHVTMALAPVTYCRVLQVYICNLFTFIFAFMSVPYVWCHDKYKEINI